MIHLSFLLCGTMSSFYRHCFVCLFTSTVFNHRQDTKVKQRDILFSDWSLSLDHTPHHTRIEDYIVKCVGSKSFIALLVHDS